MAPDNLNRWLSRDFQTRMGRCTRHLDQSSAFMAAETMPRHIEREIATVENLERGYELLRGNAAGDQAAPGKGQRLRPPAPSRARRLVPTLSLCVLMAMTMVTALTLLQMQG
jgi:hypothetical protein